MCFFSSQQNLQKAVILASHTDSPALKLKPQPTFYKENMTLLRVEPYGVPLLNSWLNRDLALAGRVVITEGGSVEERLVYLNDSICFIPQLAVHLNREVNEKGFLLNKHEHLCPIMGLCDKAGEEMHVVEKVLRTHLSFHTLLSFELFLVPYERPCFIGFNNEMISSYRLDNLASAHARSLCISCLRTCTKHLADGGLLG